MADTLKTLKTLRQSRRFDGTKLSAGELQTILDIARWTGSSRNSQPWQLVVVDDSALLQHLADVRPLNAWLAHAAVAIAIVLPAETNASHNYDEGRLSERIMLAADVLGLGSGTAWFTTAEEQAAARKLLGVPDDTTLRSLVVIGRVSDDPAERGRGSGGRKPLEEIVSYNAFGKHER